MIELKQVAMFHVSNLKECWINVYMGWHSYVLGRAHETREDACDAAHVTKRLYRIHVRLK